MENDVYPELYELIKKEFDSKVSKNKSIQKILANNVKGKTLSDVSLLANDIGMYAAESLIDVLDEDHLPDGVLYFNILERSVIDIMEEVHKLVNQMFVIVQTNVDQKQKIGIKPIESKFNKERLMDVINKVAHEESEVQDEEQE